MALTDEPHPPPLSAPPLTATAAPHGVRLVAFALDLLAVMAVTAIAGEGWPLLLTLAVFVTYHTALVWLTGQTIGKALGNLAVRRLDATPYVRTSRGLWWALGRVTVGYLVVDMFGLGVLVALSPRNPARRCLHDWVFASQVVMCGERDWALPKLRRRLSDFARQREDASKKIEEIQQEPRRLRRLWVWLVAGAELVEKGVGLVQHAFTWLSGTLGGAKAATTAPKFLSAKVTAGVVSGTAAATCAGVVVITLLLPPGIGAGGDDSTLAADAEHLEAPAVAVDADGVVHTAWVEGLADEARIVHRYLEPGGQWSQPEVLTEETAHNGAPSLVRHPGGRMCAFWGASDPQGLHLRCFDDGVWSARELVEDRGLTASYAPGFAADGTLASVYEVPGWFIGFDGEELTPEDVTPAWPLFAVDTDGRLHAVWGQFASQTGGLTGSVHRFSEDGGETWSDPTLVDGDVQGSDLVADDEGNVHWMAGWGGYRRWTPDEGWSELVEADGVTGLNYGRLAIEDGGQVVAVFPASDGLYLAEQRDDGSFSQPWVVAAGGTAVETAAIAVDEDRVRHLVWIAGGERPAIFYAARP